MSATMLTPCTTCKIQVGRVQALSAGELGGVAWDVSGDRVRLRGAIYSDGVTDSKTLRAQLMGHVDSTEEEAVPVIWGADSSIDGYYRVLAASVDMRGASLQHGLFDVSVELERVASFANPLFESLMPGALLANVHAVAVASPFHAVPGTGATTAYSNDSVTAYYTRTGDEGVMQIAIFSTFDITPVYRISPAHYYRGAATIEMRDAASVYRTVVGRQIVNAPTAWRLNNSLVTVAPSATPGGLTVSHYDGTQFESKEYFFAIFGGSFVDSFTDVVVLRNSPEEVVIRLEVTHPSGLSVGRPHLDLALRRGDRWVRCVLESEVAWQWQVIRSAAEASDSITAGIVATANDAAGNRFMLLSPDTITKDLANGAIRLTSAGTRFVFGIGSEVGGSGAAVPNQATGTRNMTEQYFASQSERMVVAGR